MTKTRFATLRSATGALLLAAVVAAAPHTRAQAPAWDATKFFRYDIENVVVTPTGAPSTWAIKVIFSVANPTLGGTWDIKNALPFQSTGASMTLDIGWDPATDFNNAGSAGALLTPIVTTALGSGAAIPVQVRNLHTATGAARCVNNLDCPGITDFTNRFSISKTITPVAFTRAVATGRVALEGKPVCNGVAGYSCPAGPPFANIPVQSAVASIALGATESLAAIIPDPRRAIVAFAKCQACHNGKPHGATVVPRLSLHGGNRNENLGLCVMCHNPDQTDVPYRYLTSGTTADHRIGDPEVPIDFKTMIHSIHSGGFRRQPFVVIGFGSSVNDFSGVRFPAKLSDCTNCHLDANGKGTFELPLKSSVLGTTVNTQSVYQVPPGATRTINVNPATHLKITPIAAACSACHDESEVKSHMVKTGGASFSTTQANIGTTVKERCAGCHGPGKQEDVRKAHEIGGGGGGGGGGGHSDDD